MGQLRRIHRLAARSTWIVLAAGLGLGLAWAPSHAGAGLVPPITIPGLTTITVPTLPLPTVTEPPAGTTPGTTTAPVTTTAPGATTAGGATPPPMSVTATTTTTVRSDSAGAATPAIGGARRLADGLISIPVSSVQAPARLVIRVSFTPKVIRQAKQPVTVKVSVLDTRAYVVRGARVALRSVPAGMLVRLAPKLSAQNGKLSFVARPKTLRGRSLALRITSRAASTTVRIPVRYAKHTRLDRGIRG